MIVFVLSKITKSSLFFIAFLQSGYRPKSYNIVTIKIVSLAWPGVLQGENFL